MPYGTRIFDSYGEIQEDVLKEINQTPYVPVSSQTYTIKDPKTNRQVRRFHGAFEGGFSAGYYNTVGSKEGFTPTTFRSSKNEKVNIEQDIRDYMDEEDVREILGERKLVKTDTFEDPDTYKKLDPNIAKAQMEMQRGHINLFGDINDNPVVSPSKIQKNDSIFEARVPVGEKLLRRMGWKGKEAIGHSNALKMQKTYTASLPPVDSDYEPVDIRSEELRVTVSDTPLPIIPKKTNLHGIDYVPETKGMLTTKEEQDSGRLEWKNTDKKIEHIIIDREEYEDSIPLPPFVQRKKRKISDDLTSVNHIDYIDAPGPLTYNPGLLRKENEMDTRKEIFRGFHLGTVYNEVGYPLPIVPINFDPFANLRPASDASISGALTVQQRAKLLMEVPLANQMETIIQSLNPEEQASVKRAMETTSSTVQFKSLQELSRKGRDSSERSEANRIDSDIDQSASRLPKNIHTMEHENHAQSMPTSILSEEKRKTNSSQERIPIDIFKVIFEEDDENDDYIEAISQPTSIDTFNGTVNPFRNAQPAQPQSIEDIFSISKGFEIFNKSNPVIEKQADTEFKTQNAPSNSTQEMKKVPQKGTLVIKKRSNKIQSRKRIDL